MGLRAVDVDVATLAGLIRETIAPGTWGHGGADIEVQGQTLLVSHGYDALLLISRFLDRLGT